MIRVTLEFPSVEAAIASLGKLMVGAPVKTPAIQAGAGETAGGAKITGAEGQQTQQSSGAPTTRTRKPRADAGKKRGPHNADAPSGEAPKSDASPTVLPSGPAPQPAAPVAPAEGDKPQPSGVTPPVAAAPSEADAQAALEKVFAGKGLQSAQAVLAGFGVTRLRDIKPEDRAAFIAAAEKAAA